jgi:hypothetical protein
MPEIKDDAFKSLQEAFQEVAFRANRLREWMELDRYLRFLERRFSDFHSEVQRIAGPPPNLVADSFPRLNSMWARYRETELVDLQTFAAGVRHINRSSWNEQMNGNASQANASSMRVINITNLDQLTETLEQALTGLAINDLAQRCALFRRTLNGQIADRQNIVNTEVQEMCELTIRLRMQLQT